LKRGEMMAKKKETLKEWTKRVFPTTEKKRLKRIEERIFWPIFKKR